jgi:hypothetical protein
MGFSGSRGPRGQHLPGTVANDLIQQRPMTSRLVVGLGAIVNYREHGRTLPASAPKPVLIRATGLSDHPREGAPTFTPPHRGSSSGTDHCSAAESPMSSARNPVSTQSKGWRIGSRSRPDGHDLGTLAVALYRDTTGFDDRSDCRWIRRLTWESWRNACAISSDG